MNVLSRFLATIVLCLPSAGMSVEETLWRPVDGKVGWWIFESPDLIIQIAMKNEGLEFTAAYRCPLGSVMKQADLRWYAGDTYSVIAMNCNGLQFPEDISFHLDPDFIANLPTLARIHFEGTRISRAGRL